MTVKISTYRLLFTLLLCIVQAKGAELYAQHTSSKADSVINMPQARKHRITSTPIHQNSATLDSLGRKNDKSMNEVTSSKEVNPSLLKTDSIPASEQKPLFVPNSTRAVWLATVIPGGGQIYNRKYWKLPIIYGGFMTCAYALAWNNQYYKDYSQAYLDIMDNNPKTDSYLDFLAPNYDITGKEDWLKKVLKQKKDSYRRYRDLSIFAFIGIYLVSIIDAYVDAELSNFDISPDIGLQIEPTVINNHNLSRNTLGVQCSIKF